MQGTIYSIAYKPIDIESRPETHFARVKISTAKLIVGHGIEGDRKGGHPKRQVNIMAYESLQRFKGNGFTPQPGELGEQIIVQGLDVDSLQSGDVIQIGEHAQLEVTQARTSCRRFEAFQVNSLADTEGCMGMMARVLQEGDIRVGDSVAVVKEVVNQSVAIW